jgi:hypothetical protein
MLARLAIPLTQNGKITGLKNVISRTVCSSQQSGGFLMKTVSLNAAVLIPRVLVNCLQAAQIPPFKL